MLISCLHVVAIRDNVSLPFFMNSQLRIGVPGLVICKFVSLDFGDNKDGLVALLIKTKDGLNNPEPIEVAGGSFQVMEFQPNLQKSQRFYCLFRLFLPL